MKQLGIGEYGPIYDAEVRLKTNITSRALVKVSDDLEWFATVARGEFKSSCMLCTHYSAAQCGQDCMCFEVNSLEWLEEIMLILDISTSIL